MSEGARKRLPVECIRRKTRPTHQCHLFVCTAAFLETLTSLKVSTPVAYPVHTVFLNTSKDYKACLIQEGHSLEAFHPNKTEKSGRMRNADMEAPRASVHRPCRSPVLDVVRLSSTVRFGDRTKSNIELNCFQIIPSNCSYIPERRVISGIRRSMSVRPPRSRCLTKMEYIRQQKIHEDSYYGG